jgi:hypothetical protein
VTSNLSLRFVRGIPVGRIRRIQHDASGLMQEVEVEPAAQLARLRQAFVTPGPVAPDEASLPRPHVEFEPRRVAAPPPLHAKPGTAAPAATPAAKPAARPARPDSAHATGGTR